MPAGREVLRTRTRQPGHDLAWRAAETRFSAAARALLPDRYVVEDKPADLRGFYASGPRQLGLEPEAKILDTVTGRYVYVEVKRQGRHGNAEERAYKHHTPGFVRRLAELTGLEYHSYVTVFCEDLATLRRYTMKIAAHLDAPHYLLWARYDPLVLADWLDELRDRFLDPDRTCPVRSHALALALPREALPGPPPSDGRFEPGLLFD